MDPTKFCVAVKTTKYASWVVNSQQSVIDCRQHLPHLPSLPGVNTRPTNVTVYIALANGQHTVAKFSKSRILDKVPEGSSHILEIHSVA